MLFNSYEFLLFFPIVVIVNFLLPHRVRYIWLLVTSYYFYMCWNPKYVLLLLGSTLITYVSGLLMERMSHKRLVVAGSLILNLGILVVFKYANFLTLNGNRVLERIGIGYRLPVLSLLLPVGISFYIFQALSYTMDVYRGEIAAEKNIFRYALFVSFFPQLVAGPIERSKVLLPQLKCRQNYDFERVKNGLLLMIWGFFLKLVIADRIAMVVDEAYNLDKGYGAGILLLATFLFAFEIYCDFAGYSAIAIGAAKVLGYSLTENFDSPYLASSVQDFWRRWHISLTRWFRDYLYIPLGGNRKGAVRQFLNLMIVFLLSGLWHGAQWSFVVWGGLNGFYLVVEAVLGRIRKKHTTEGGAGKRHGENPFGKAVRIVWTFILVDFTWLFFAAGSLSNSIIILKRIGKGIGHCVEDLLQINMPGMSQKQWIVLAAALFIMVLADVVKYLGGSIRMKLMKCFFVWRWLVVIIAILAILVFGVYGSGYREANFLYFQF